MTSADNKDLVTTQEKLEWITPKISIMGAVDTSGGLKITEPVEYGRSGEPGVIPAVGPS